MMTIRHSEERQFTERIKDFLTGKTLYFCGLKHGEGWEHKKLVAKVLRVDTKRTTIKEGSKCDVLMYHDGIDLDYDHKLSNPFKLELKIDTTWKNSLVQAIRYKFDSEQKYGEHPEGKMIEVGVSTPNLFSTGTFTPSKCPSGVTCTHQTREFDSFQYKSECQQFDIKRIFWKSGVALLEFNRLNNTYEITANEGDKIRIQ